MKFSQWILKESTLSELYQSAVKAFPETTKRQFAIHEVKITQLTWIPYKGMKTLFVKGIARNQQREYNTIIVFKGVKYLESGGVQLIDNTKQKYFLEQLSLDDTEVLTRCNCSDFRFRFGFYNSIDKSLFGKNFSKYESKGIRGPVNPSESPGICKHLMSLIKVLRESKITK